MRKAVIDVGSNSVLLTVAERGAQGWKTLAETSTVTSLGEGTRETRLLSEPGIRHTLEALKDAFEAARSYGATDIVACATMAARIAENAGDFLGRAAEQGTPVEVLSGEQEAQLGFLSVANDPAFRSKPAISIIDVGGQSTEIVHAARSEQGWNTTFQQSFPVGTLGLRGSLLSSESPSEGDLVSASSAIDAAIAPCGAISSPGAAIVLGATGTNLVSIRDGLLEWQPERVHGAVLGYEEVSGAVSRLSRLSDAGRRAVPGMEPGREKTLHIGALILERAMFAIHAQQTLVSTRGWRHALLESGLPERASANDN